jgi:hypothetical protein
VSLNVPGTHFQGPVLASDKSEGGLFDDLPSGSVDRLRSPYKVYVETFDYPIASGAAALTGSGCTVTDINTATSPTQAVTGAAPYLLLNAGTKADSGSEFQWNTAVSQATYTLPATRVIPPIVSTTTLMDSRELLFWARVGFNSSSTTWDSKFLLGICATDTSLLVNTTGVPGLPTGGGIGFHVGEDGILRYFAQQAALTVAGTSTGIYTNHLSGTNLTTTGAATVAATGTLYIHTYGFRVKFTDASAGTGLCQFYFDGRKIGTPVTTGLPFQSTETYSVSFSVQNGPTSSLVDLSCDGIVTAITRPTA